MGETNEVAIGLAATGASVVLRWTSGRTDFKWIARERLAGWSEDGRSVYGMKVYASVEIARIAIDTGARGDAIENKDVIVSGLTSAGPAKAVIHWAVREESRTRSRYVLVDLERATVIGEVGPGVPATILGVPEHHHAGARMQVLAPTGPGLPEGGQGRYRLSPGMGAVSMDGTRFLTDADGARRDQLLVRDPEGTERSTVQTEDGTAINYATFDADGFVVVGLADGSLARLDLATAQWRWRTRCHGRPLAAFQRSFDGRTFYSYGRDDRVCATGADGQTRWSVALRRPRAAALHNSRITGTILLSPDGGTIAVETPEAVRILDAATGAERSVLEGHLDCVARVAFSRDGERVASGGWDGDVRVYRASTGETEWIMEAGDDEVSGVEFLHDGATLRSCGRDGCVRRWSLLTGFEEEAWEADHDAHLQSRESRDGSRTLVWSGARYALWDDRGPQREVWSLAVVDEKGRNRYWPGGGPFVCYAAFSRDPSRVLVGLKTEAEDRRGRLWRLETLDAVTGEAVEAARPLSGWLVALQELDDDTVLVLGEQEDVVIVSERPEVPELRLQGAVSGASFVREACVSSDGRWVALRNDERVDLWRLSSTPWRIGFIDRALQGDGPTSLAIAPDGRTLAVGTSRGCVLLFEVAAPD